MSKRIVESAKSVWRAAPLASLILAIALAASLFFGTNAFLHWYNRAPLMDREQPIAAWMTPRYVARAWGIPHNVIREAIGRPDQGQKGLESLKQISQDRGVPIEQLLAELQSAIVEFREEHDPPKPAVSSEGARND